MSKSKDEYMEQYGESRVGQHFAQLAAMDGYCAGYEAGFEAAEAAAHEEWRNIPSDNEDMRRGASQILAAIQGRKHESK